MKGKVYAIDGAFVCSRERLVPDFLQSLSRLKVSVRLSLHEALRAHDDQLGEQLDEVRRELGRGRTQRLRFPGKIHIDLPAYVGRDLHHRSMGVLDRSA